MSVRYRSYPECDELRSGCKVGWRRYLNRIDAEKCSKAAKYNAEIDLMLGYDFGYCMPGSITKLPDGRYEVCVS